MKTCACGTSLSRQNKSGRCLKCHARSPEGRAARARNMKAVAARIWHGEDPDARQRILAATTERVHRTLLSEDGKANAKAKREQATETKRRKALEWCPQSMRETYFFLRNVKRLSVPECRSMVLEMHEAQLRRARREIEAFNAEQKQRHARQKAQAL